MENDRGSSRGVIVVTGAGRGLGKALCLELLKQGQSVAALSRSLSSMQELTNAAPSDQLLTVPVDIADPAAVSTAFAEVREKMGAVSGLINNAAVYSRRDILDETYESFMRTLNVNLGGMIACTQEALQDMVAIGEGKVVNVTCYAGTSPAPASVAYSVSKGATRIFNNALFADIEDRFPDIIINEWLPGPLNTDMDVPQGLDVAEVARWGTKLALLRDPAISGLMFDRDRSVARPVGFKRRVLNRILQRQERVVHLA